MARSLRDLKGWQFFLGNDESENKAGPESIPPHTPSRRARRGEQSAHTRISLLREADELRIQAGDTVFVLQKTNDSQIAFIKEILLGVQNFMDVRVYWFVKMDEVSPQNLPKDADYEPTSINRNEIFLTAYEEEIHLSQIICKVSVLSHAEFYRDIVLDESTLSTTFMVQRACDSKGSVFSDKFDYRELHSAFLTDPAQFTAFIRQQSLPSPYKLPSKRGVTSNPMSSPTKQQGTFPGKLSTPTKRIAPSPRKRLDSSPTKRLGRRSLSLSEESDGSDSDSSSISDTDSSLDSDTPWSGRRGSKPSPRKRRKYASPRKASRQTNPASPRSLEFMKLLVDQSFKVKSEAKRPLLPLSPRKPLAGTVESQAFKEIKARLHASSRLTALRGREVESDQLLANLATAIESETGCCIYVSGTPGVGKTATVRNVIQQLQEYAQQGAFKQFGYLEINGLKLLTPNVAYQLLCTHLLGITVSPSNAANALTNFFEKRLPEIPQLVLLDELDQMVTKNQKLMYNFFNWPSIPTSKLVVIAVANTMDLPERVLTNKISSRLGLNRIQFVGYSHEQLSDIIKSRLDLIRQHRNHQVIVKPDAVAFASRKVASVSGDARRALTICRRAVEIAEKEYKPDSGSECYVTIGHINRAINETINSPIAQYLMALPFEAKLVLHALILRMNRTGVLENSLGDVIDEMQNSLKLMTSKGGYQALGSLGKEYSLYALLYQHGILENDPSSAPQIRAHNFRGIVAELTENGVLVQQNVASERHRMLILSISKEEVSLVLRRDENIAGML